MTAIKDFNPNEEYLLVKGEKNIRERGSQCAKYYDEMFDISSYQNIDGQEQEEDYALLYYKLVKQRNDHDY